MVVTLIRRDEINKITLPKQVEGSYWLTNNQHLKLINIEGINGKWQIRSNSQVRIMDNQSVKITNEKIEIDWQNQKTLEKVELKEQERYILSCGNSMEPYILYCMPMFEKDMFHLEIKNTNEITIGRKKSNGIVYNDDFVSLIHAKLSFYNGRWEIENFDSKYGTFVNGKPVSREGTLIQNGDVISILGLRMILIGKRLFMNNPKGKISYNREVLEQDKTRKNKQERLEPTESSIQQPKIEEQYFSRAPRISNIIEKVKVKIDAPPASQEREETPIILVLGSSLSMGAMMMVSIINAIDGRINGTATLKQTILSLTVAIAMLIAMIVFPILTVKYDRNKRKRYEARRQKKYKEYLASKKRQIEAIMKDQRKVLLENYTSVEECAEIIINRGARLWERKIEDYDFLHVRWGIGDIDLNIDIEYPEERFSMEDDNLVEILQGIASQSKILKDAPIVTSLVEKNISALLIPKGKEQQYKFIQNIIIQLITYHSYEDLKLVFLVDEDTQKRWDYIKTLPHVWDNASQIRFFADNYDDMKEVSKYLEEEFEARIEEKDADYRNFTPYYMIITDNYQKIENLKIVKEILKTKINVGFSMLCIGEDLMQLPNECKTFVSLGEEEGVIFENEISANTKKTIHYDTSVTFFFNRLCQSIANIPIRYIESKDKILPNSYSFLEMYDIGKIEQLNVLERWQKSNAILSLKAPIGIDSAGMPIVLDIHEKYHGPHGLIAGSTGSGKSEFIITYILSLAINYHPDDVTFILIDYKGGGLAGAFQKRNIKLPHLVGTITNIDTIGLQRSLDSIQSELRKRQMIFNEARNMTDEGTIDIYKYQKLYHEGLVKKPVPHLLIICDEFAELKQQQAEFMEELMSVSRIGRSLGVHLILATQKPAGIVNDQIRSNSKFAVCLKVQEKADSVDVIRKPDAANLKRTGQFYLQVGNDEYFTMGQSAWAGAPYFPSDDTEKKQDDSIEFVSNIGETVKQLDEGVQRIISSQGEQLTNIVRYLSEIAKQNHIKAENLWLDTIPENIYLNELRKKYKETSKKNIINPVIGEYDDPYNQIQGIITMDLTGKGNTIIYGNAESGKETLLSTMIYDVMEHHTTEEVQIYILDFGSEALKIYLDSPHVGDVIFAGDDEKVSRFFTGIQKEIRERKSILSDYNGDYNLYISMNKEAMPMQIIVLNNYESFSEIYESKYDDLLLTITREGIKCGIVFVFTVSNNNDIRYRLAQNFKQKIALQLNKEDDYYNIFENVKKKRPSKMFGRGLVMLDNSEIYEFQTAKICKAEQYNDFIKNQIQKLNEKGYDNAPTVPVLPERVTIESVKDYLVDLSKVPVGILKEELSVGIYNFKRNFMNIITSRNIEDATQFTIYLMAELHKLKKLNIAVFDAERMITSKKIDIKEEYNKFIEDVETAQGDVLCVIFGIDRFLMDYEDSEHNFMQSLKRIENCDNCNFIVVDSAPKLKVHEYDEWYKRYIVKDNGIWVGSGVDNQYVITINSDRRTIVNQLGNTFGYIINQGEASLVKLLEMREDHHEI